MLCDRYSPFHHCTGSQQSASRGRVLDNTSAIADHVKATGHNIKWDHFDILAKGKTDYHCKIKETLYIQELEPAFNVNVGSEKLMLY